MTKPTWVLLVSAPLPPDAIDPDAEPDATYVNTKNGNRVVVTITGGGDAAGGGGGINQISITAGGTTRDTLPPNGVQNAPTFTSTQSRCGGPLTLIVDDSGSIGSAMGTVRTGIKDFVNALAGTPVQIQIVRFDNTASVLGTAGWTKYFDMTVPADVTTLTTAVDTLATSGATNWEDAWFCTFYAADGSPSTIIPKTVVFFTDGIPTQDRILNRGTPGVLTDPPALPGPGWPASNGSDYSQVGFNRADFFASQWRAAADTRLIAVGVGPGIGSMTGTPAAGTTSTWMESPGVGYHVGWEERSSFTYQQVGYTYEQRVTTYEERQTWDEQYNANPWRRRTWAGPGSWNNTSKANYDSNAQGGTYEYGIWQTTGWVSSNRAAYDAGNTNPTDTDGWKRSNPSGGWISRTLAQYNANNTTADDTDGVRTGTVWTGTTQAVYDANNTTPDESDGYRRTQNGSWSNIMKAVYDANNTTNDSTDGFRRINPTGSWVAITQAEYNARNTTSNESDGVRTGGKVYSRPYDFWENPVTQTKRNAEILARIVSGNFNGEPWLGSLNTNEQVANLFIQPNWALFPDVMQAIALGECGGTLTLQTKLGSGYAVDPFKYTNTAINDSSGTPITPHLPTTVTTNISSTAKTFDFDISDGTFQDRRDQTGRPVEPDGVQRRHMVVQGGHHEPHGRDVPDRRHLVEWHPCGGRRQRGRVVHPLGDRELTA